MRRLLLDNNFADASDLKKIEKARALSNVQALVHRPRNLLYGPLC